MIRILNIVVVFLFIGFVVVPLGLANESAEPSWLDHITLSGAIEVEAGFESTDPAEGRGEDSSDIAIATVELSVEAEVNNYLSGNILFLYEGGEDIAIDEAVVTLNGGERCPGYLSVGEMYVPFGNFETHMISDPLTLEIGEAREAALLVGMESRGFYGSAFIFNGDVDETDVEDDHINNYGANAGYVMESDVVNFDVGLSFINNIVDANGWEDILDEETLILGSYAAGMGAHAILTAGPVTFIAEYVTALDDLEWIHEDGNTSTEEAISAWNAEIGYAFSIVEKEATVAAAFQGTDNAANRFPESRYLGSFEVGILKNTFLAVEYRHDTFENDDAADVVTAKLAIEF